MIASKITGFSRFFSNIRDRRSSVFAAILAVVLYVSYAFPHNGWSNPTLLLTAIFIGLHLPDYSRLSNRLEERLQERTAIVSLGRLGRFALQYTFNAVVFLLFLRGHVVAADGFSGIGGLLGVAAITTIASQGAQYVGQLAYRHGFGHPDTNTLLGLSANVFVTAAAIGGLPLARQCFLVGGIGLGLVVFGLGLLSDLRALIHPQGGIAIFFGTFNPFHVGHLALVRRVIEERGVEKVIIHPTVVPRFHADALARGEIRVARVENGLQIYETTEKADPKVNYFPTGNRFFSPEDRCRMIALSIADAGLSDRVEVAFMPEVYARAGFHGVFRAIRRQHPGKPMHGIHGSDFGAMLVRTIMDESGWYYPFPVVRRGSISATAIRAGAAGLTSPSVERELRGMQAMPGEAQAAA
ncbi:MAG TPA: hypothetical protein VMU42_18105 [Candidatus Sulfotelmatobacter sp.]|nr:hypothetical protein [Candidatus Sulfotelmatobacter sp.]